jgi:hypothetical protein
LDALRAANPFTNSNADVTEAEEIAIAGSAVMKVATKRRIRRHKSLLYKIAKPFKPQIEKLVQRILS